MKKKELEKAIALYDSIEGATLVDNYIAKLYKEEIDELHTFVKKVSEDVLSTPKHVKAHGFIEDIKKTYLVQLNETNQVVMVLTIDTEPFDSIEYGKYDVDIALSFRIFDKSTWLDQFVVTGVGKHGGLDIEEFKDWILLLRFLCTKKKENAKYIPTNEQMIVNIINDVEKTLEGKD